MKKALFGSVASLFLLAAGPAEDEVRARFEAFNRAWEQRDMDFIRDYYAHDPNLLLFFERRQLRGWPKVEALYQNMFANAARGRVESTVSNLDVKARGDMAYTAANFRLRVIEPGRLESLDEGRQTTVFEKRGGRWVVVHRHTSFQAPPGPQRRVALHTEPGPLWSPTLEGAWRSADGGLLLATATHLALSGPVSPALAARYALQGNVIQLTALDGAAPGGVARLERVALSPTTLSFGLPGQSSLHHWTRVE